ncbi:A24 family peptidase [Cellulomonas sp. PhB143]|uniref:prepilin peptidase n=1 Tax=Cellulomonas sp. PhB143 TaxID=2485186 RepID=UPI000FB138D5|nr:A24 family peptidase [Cellulomonas sp. PhB143]ROS74552.1 leader peptidase (prepilin peptidase)/N-methyltransferase [Cellulomonas sp. PhB143]
MTARGTTTEHAPSAVRTPGDPGLVPRAARLAVGWAAGRAARARAELAPHRTPALVVACLAAAAAAVWSGLAWQTPAFVLLAATLGALSVVDARTHRLPDAVVLPAAVAGASLLALAALAGGEPAALGRAALGGTVLAAVYLGLALAAPGGLGLGDVKLAAPVGAHLAWLGWTPLLLGGAAAFLVGGLVALALVVAGRATRRTAIPFGPCMALGAAVGAVLGPAAALV